ncbi:BLOC-1-related complex subunit 7 isoform X4 [Passer montanus]|uniref:BLOC-1-related complex subunit 7 isoform X4 n=1 Tax=Passer montanus TaxID=9160 RepID=UPI001960D2DB|nr:BLOC-1-related complex subunit 7 isoform X4 [Passer montanus]
MGSRFQRAGGQGMPRAGAVLGVPSPGPCGDSSRCVLGAVSTAGGSAGALEPIAAGERLDRSGREWAARDTWESAEHPSSSALVRAGETRIALDTAGQPSAVLLLGQAARNMVMQEDAILHSEDSLRKMAIITTHLQYQQEAIQKNVERSSNLQDQLSHLLK